MEANITIQDSVFLRVNNIHTARRMAPWASFYEKVPDGYMCFKTYGDWKVWRDSEEGKKVYGE